MGRRERGGSTNINELNDLLSSVSITLPLGKFKLSQKSNRTPCFSLDHILTSNCLEDAFCNRQKMPHKG